MLSAAGAGAYGGGLPGDVLTAMMAAGEGGFIDMLLPWGSKSYVHVLLMIRWLQTQPGRWSTPEACAAQLPVPYAHVIQAAGFCTSWAGHCLTIPVQLLLLFILCLFVAWLHQAYICLLLLILTL
jgi:hypothetical protein